MELEFREAFLKDLKRIKETAVKKKITAVISNSREASSLFDLKMSRNWKAALTITEFALGITGLASSCRKRN